MSGVEGGKEEWVMGIAKNERSELKGGWKKGLEKGTLERTHNGAIEANADR
jgi:hypothetical protein